MESVAKSGISQSVSKAGGESHASSAEALMAAIGDVTKK